MTFGHVARFQKSEEVSSERHRAARCVLMCRFRGRRSTLWTFKCRFRGGIHCLGSLAGIISKEVMLPNKICSVSFWTTPIWTPIIPHLMSDILGCQCQTSEEDPLYARPDDLRDMFFTPRDGDNLSAASVGRGPNRRTRRNPRDRARNQRWFHPAL